MHLKPFPWSTGFPQQGQLCEMTSVFCTSGLMKTKRALQWVHSYSSGFVDLTSTEAQLGHLIMLVLNCFHSAGKSFVSFRATHHISLGALRLQIPKLHQKQPRQPCHLTTTIQLPTSPSIQLGHLTYGIFQQGQMLLTNVVLQSFCAGPVFSRMCRSHDS